MHEPQTRWLADGRSMELLERVDYYDRHQRYWFAPRGAVVNGASIPRFLWRAIGCPFVGKYRNATILHDYHCVVRLRRSPLVHAMFYDKMIADGTPRVQAWLMWLAVRVFGPRFGGQRDEHHQSSRRRDVGK